MKNLLSILFCVFSFSTFGQNWFIITSSDRFNYGVNGDSLISVTIYADSFDVSGTDTVFYLNRIYCDSCYTIPNGSASICDTCYGLKNQPQFLQRKIIQSGNGIVNLRDTCNLIINTLANTGDSWLFDSLQNITATVVSSGAISIFGSMDSIKSILLSSNDTIVLSKANGIIKYPVGYGSSESYYLLGIEGRNVGLKVPGFKDIFNFDVDDMFEYRTEYFDGAGYSSYDIISKYRIISKVISGDSLIYAISGKRNTREYCQIMFLCNPMYSSYHLSIIADTLIYVDSVSHIMNRYNNELVSLENTIKDDFGNGYAMNNSGPKMFFGPVLCDVDSNQVFKKYLSTKSPAMGIGNYFDGGSSISDSLTDVMMPRYQFVNWDGASLTAGYGNGLGQLYYAVNPNFEGYSYEVLKAYRKGNDTVGVFTPDWMLDDVSNLIIDEPSIIIWPNPAKDKLYVKTDFVDWTYRLTNLSGQEVLNGREVNGIDINCLSKGIYFIQINSNEFSGVRKIVIE